MFKAPGANPRGLRCWNPGVACFSRHRFPSGFLWLHQALVFLAALGRG